MRHRLKKGILLLLAVVFIAGCGGTQDLTPYEKQKQETKEKRVKNIPNL